MLQGWPGQPLASLQPQQLVSRIVCSGDHLESIFAKANVNSRQALVATLFFGYWAPQHERAAIPSPFGHYLGDGDGASNAGRPRR